MDCWWIKVIVINILHRLHFGITRQMFDALGRDRFPQNIWHMPVTIWSHCYEVNSVFGLQEVCASSDNITCYWENMPLCCVCWHKHGVLREDVCCCYLQCFLFLLTILGPNSEEPLHLPWVRHLLLTGSLREREYICISKLWHLCS